MIFFLFFHLGHSWGLNGHRIIGEIAESHLHKNVKSKLEDLLGQKTLAEVSNWADDMKSNPAWKHSKYWHYINIPKEKSYFKIEHHPKGDLLQALYHFDKVLRNSKLNTAARLQALKFLVHLIGDMHQPLHVGYKRDRGGNKIKVKWFGKKTNLHSLWDTYLIEHARLSYTEYTRFINHFSRKEKKEWASGGYLDWAYESRELRDGLYNVGNRAGYRYYHQHVDLLNRQLKKAGLHLAFTLNQIFLKHRFKGREKNLRRKFQEIKGPFSNISL